MKENTNIHSWEELKEQLQKGLYVTFIKCYPTKGNGLILQDFLYHVAQWKKSLTCSQQKYGVILYWSFRHG